MQFDQKDRGFSFRKEAALDMRMDPSLPLSARDLINKWSEEQLGRIFREYGEEPFWKISARAIVEARKKNPIETTTELATLLEKVISKQKSHLHVATRVFQALRMAVNDELKSIESGIKKALGFLSQNGRIGVLSFHRLEDRIVKHIFQEASKPLKNLQGFEIAPPMFDLLYKKPMVPSVEEIRRNRRSRSAKLRFARKKGQGVYEAPESLDSLSL